MYNIDTNGLTLPNLNDIIDYLTNGFKTIYGDNINLEQNTPDGQFLNILAQCIIDLQELSQYIYNSFDLENSEGRALDRNAGIIGVQRQAGSYTIVPIDIVANDTTTLQGLDSNYTNPTGTGFTVSDNNGNNYILISSTTILSGTTTLQFRAQEIGAIEPVLNTITNITTPQLGIVSANNSSAPLIIGVDEESDKQLKDRINNSFALGGTGSFENIKSYLYQLQGVISVGGENNNTGSTSSNGTPAHSVWVIVEGGDDDYIANTIYKTLNTGCPMRGATEVKVIDQDGVENIIKFDRPSTESLYILMTVEAKDNNTVIDTDIIKTNLINNLKLGLNDIVDSSKINNILTNIDDTLIYYDIQVSKDGITYSNMVNNTNLNYIFTLSSNNINITVN